MVCANAPIMILAPCQVAVKTLGEIVFKNEKYAARELELLRCVGCLCACCDTHVIHLYNHHLHPQHPEPPEPAEVRTVVGRNDCARAPVAHLLVYHRFVGKAQIPMKLKIVTEASDWGPLTHHLNPGGKLDCWKMKVCWKQQLAAAGPRNKVLRGCCAGGHRTGRGQRTEISAPQQRCPSVGDSAVACHVVNR